MKDLEIIEPSVGLVLYAIVMPSLIIGLYIIALITVAKGQSAPVRKIGIALGMLLLPVLGPLLVLLLHKNH